MLGRALRKRRLRLLGSGLRSRRIEWPPTGLTTELLRLLVECPVDGGCKILGLHDEEIAAWRFAALGVPGGGLWVADDGRRLVGLIKIVPDSRASLTLGKAIWNLTQVALLRDAPEGTLGALLGDVLTGIGEPVEVIQVRVPTLDVRLMRELPLAGFSADTGLVEMALRLGDLVPQRPAGPALQPLRHWHIERTIGLACLADPICPLWDESRFERSRLEALHAQKILEHLSDRDSGALVDEGADRAIAGVVGYRLLREAEEYAGLRIAAVDLFLPAAAGAQQPDEAARLVEGLDSHLEALGAEGVVVELSLHDDAAAEYLKAFVDAGYTPAATSQIYRLWLNELEIDPVRRMGPSGPGR